MAEPKKPPAVQNRTDRPDMPPVQSDKTAEERWFLDALEDDEVREVLKNDRSTSRNRPV